MKKKISISFDSMWVLSQKDSAQLPVPAVVEEIKKVLAVEVLDTSLTECELLVSGDNITEETIKQQIEKLIKSEFSIESLDGIVECNITDYVQETSAPKDEVVFDLLEDLDTDNPEEKPAAKEEKPVEKEEESKLEQVKERIATLIGAEEFKHLAEEYIKVAPMLIKHNTVDTFTHQCYLFAINEGNGLSTYLELFADLIQALNLFNFEKSKRIVEVKLPAPQSKEAGNNPFAMVEQMLHRYHSNEGKVISIDISEWMTHITDVEFRQFLSQIDDYLGKDIIVFRVPFVEKEIMKGLRKGLADVLYVRDVSFVPFDHTQLIQCAEESLKKIGFSMEEEAWKVFDARITEEKNDGRFYGINTVNKVIREMIYLKQLHNAANGIDDTLIKKAEILDLADSYDEQEKSGLELLDDFIGMETIRKRVEEIVGQIEMSAKNEKLGSPCIHMRFVGNPGTGKTTVARVIGKILKEKGILRNGNFFEYSGRDFCGRYVGETAPKTAAMCRDAYGSVLFIDEAYSLYRGDGFSKADYGREAIDTLIAEMENHRTDLVVIMAGYPDEMKDLMTANAGLESRMPFIIEFPNYTRQQLADIFMMMVKKSFTYLEGFEEAVKSYFDSLPDEVVLAKEFSNARFARNLFERTWGKAVMRAQLNKADPTVLTKEDFMLASSEKEFKKIMVKPNRTLGFI